MMQVHLGLRVATLRWVAFAVLAVAPSAAFGATITVNSTADVAANDGQCTLREAITAANTNTASGAAAGECAAGQAFPIVDTITFNIPGAGVHTISLTSAVPAITGPVVIDGYTQPGASPNTLAVGNDAVLRIEIDSTAVTLSADVFQFLGGGGSTVRGLVVNRVPNGVRSFNIGFSSASNNNTIAGNFIGTDAAGAVFLGSGDGYIFVGNGTGNTIGGTTPAARNVIVGGAGLGVIDLSSSGNLVQGNYIGVNAAGTASLQPPNATVGIRSESGAGNNTIGGTTPGAGNLIVATNAGVLLGNQNNLVQGNFIGTNATGTAGLGGGIGIFIDASNNTIGGGAAGAGNLISGGTTGIHINSPATVGTIIQGNKIGTDITGTAAIPNSNFGINVASLTVTASSIGGANPGEGNTIAFNGGDGVRIGGSPGAGWPILGNSIFSNAGLGINLTGGSENAFGATANDLGDADTGANNLQNYPVLTSAVTGGGNVFISGSLNSTASTTFRIEFFSNTACDASGLGEGKTFLGSSTVTTDGGGNVSFNSLSFPAAGGAVITSTATLNPSAGVFTDTSEFSACASAAAQPDLTISKTHTGNFVQGSSGNNYTVIVTNSGAGDKLAGQAVSVTDAPPSGLTVTAMSGTGWTCTTLPTCTRSDVLAAGNSYPPLTVTVSVAASASSPQVNSISVTTAQAESNTGNNTATDSTNIVPGGGPAPIPTLSEWAMIFLGLLLAALAFRHLRRQSSSHV